jgi:hypothetical protein
VALAVVPVKAAVATHVLMLAKVMSRFDAAVLLCPAFVNVALALTTWVVFSQFATPVVVLNVAV